MADEDNSRDAAPDDGAAGQDGFGKRAAKAAETLYEGARETLADNPELARAADDLRRAIRRNPLAAIVAAFVAGLLLALLTRG